MSAGIVSSRSEPMGMRLIAAVAALVLVTAGAPAQAAETYVPLVRVGADPWEGVPLPLEGADDIGPGSRLETYFDGYGYGAGCTANFVWRDIPSGRLFLGSAGHCYLPFDVQTSVGLDTSFIHPFVHLRSCFQDGETCTYEKVALGQIAYAKQLGIGHDFGLAEIPPSLYGRIRPAMPRWGAFTGAVQPYAGTPLFFYGQGYVFGGQEPTRARAGLSATGTLDSFIAAGHANPGDSGSPATGIEGRTDVGRVGAAGIITGSVLLPNGFGAGAIGGTTVSGAVKRAREAGLEIEPVGTL